MNIEESAFKDRKTLANLNAIDLLDIIEFLQLDRKQWINQFSKTHNESIDIQKENQELKQKYENAVADYETTMAEKNELKRQNNNFKTSLDESQEVILDYIKENQELKQINEEHKKLNGDLRKENQEIRLDQTKKVFHVLTYVLLNGGCTYRYLIYDLLGFKLENYSDLIEGMNIVNAIATLEEVKKQLKDKTEDYKRMKDNFDSKVDVLTEIDTQQKEFIKYLEDEIYSIEPKGTGINYNCEYDSEEDYVMAMQEQSRLNTLKENLQKYKSIIGGSDENNIK